MKCTMLDFAPGESRVAYTAASLQRSQFSPIANLSGDDLGVLQFEQDNS